MKPRGRIDLKGEMKERMIHMVPAEPLWDVFTPDVIANLRQVRSPSQRLQTRLRILDAGGLNPNPVNRELRAHKAAWEAYLTAAFSVSAYRKRRTSRAYSRRPEAAWSRDRPRRPRSADRG